MKKSIAVFLAASSGIAAEGHADSLRDALQGGEVKGEIRNTYVWGSESDSSGEAGAINNSNTLGTAFSLYYKTARYHGFQFSVGFQEGYDWETYDEEAGPTTSGGEDDHRVSVDSTNLQQAYIDYVFDKTITDTGIRLGRQDIKSPLLMNSSAFPMRDAFDAMVITNRDLPDTSLKLMQVENWIMRYGQDSNGSATQEDKHFDNPLYSIYVTNNSVEGLNLEAQWFSNNNSSPAGDPPAAPVTADAYTTTYLGGVYQLPGLPLSLGAKTLNADYDTEPDTGYWGVKAETRIGRVSAKLAYTSVDDDANFPGTYGHVPMFRSYKDGFTNEIFAGLDITTLTVGYDFGLPGLDTLLTYSSFDQSSTGIENSGKNYDGGFEVGTDIRYKIPAVEGLDTRLRVSYFDYDGATETNDDLLYSRFSLNYTF